MKKYVILLAGALIVLLSGCATQRPLGEADKIANSSSTHLNLTDQKGKVSHPFGDENDNESGNLNKPVTVQGQTEAAAKPGQIFRDCPDCPEMVILPKSFALGKTEVTQGQWRAVMGNNPSKFSNCGDTCPVENVSWNEAQEFILKLNAKTGKQYRLPTTDEWKYACYGGSQSEYCGGNDPNAVAWTAYNSKTGTHPVGQKQANGYGLYDMNGNVWEWMNDCYNGNCAYHIVRGSSWSEVPSTTRSYSYGYENSTQVGNGGFRLALMLDAPSTSTLPTHNKSAADRLKELNVLYKDGVITKKEFESKKKEILDSM